jgi:hypothetical protein
MGTRQPLSYQISKTGCFEVTSHLPSLSSGGYPKLRFEGKQIPTHRFVWEECFGSIPSGFCVCHKCDNPLCINPEHLFLGTQADNIKDKFEKGRQTSGESIKSSKLTPANVKTIRSRYRRYDKKNNMNALAQEFGISNVAVRHIVIGIAWKQVRRDK